MVIRYKTASGNHCCNSIDPRSNTPMISTVTKPQAVITVATPHEIPDCRSLGLVTKPQAVITVAT